MVNILELLQCYTPTLTNTNLRRLRRVIISMLAMTGRLTMLGISRWTSKGGSYSTVQRLFAEALDWAQIFWQFFAAHLYTNPVRLVLGRPGAEYILVGDESVVTKAGKHTYGLDRFFSSLLGRPVQSIAIFALSLVDVKARRSYPMRVEQVVRTEAERAAARARTRKRKARSAKRMTTPGKRGLPKGSKNRDKTQVTFTPELQRIKKMVQEHLGGCADTLPITYLALDGHYGNNNALRMTSQCGLQLVSKLRHDAALYFAYDGPYSGRGRPRKYGAKVDYRNLPEQYLLDTTRAGAIETRIYQACLLHHDFAQALNVVILIKTNLKAGAFANVNLFSSDLDILYDKLIDYYSLRFQIEFNFRDAKQHWGLEDFMNVKQTPLSNAINLSLFMVNVAHVLLREFRRTNPHSSVLDLKAYYRAARYFEETIKMLPQKPKPFLLEPLFDNIAALGSIHPESVPVYSP